MKSRSTKMAGRRLVAASGIAVGILAALIHPAAALAAPAATSDSTPTITRIEGGTTKVVPPKGQTTVTPKEAPSDAEARTLSYHGAFDALHMNLCNSGKAGCYADGMAVGEAQATINTVKPDAVTLNEVCSADVFDWLLPALSSEWEEDISIASFSPALQDSGAPVYCSNGDEYGNAIIVHIPTAEYYGWDSVGWLYGNQDGGGENRSAVCGYAYYEYYLCSTHLAAGNSSVAMLQCQAIFSSIVPQMQSITGYSGPFIVGGDFNLSYGGSPDAQACVPAGYTRKGDGHVQHFFVSNAITFNSAYILSMVYTDHPALVARLTRS